MEDAAPLSRRAQRRGEVRRRLLDAVELAPAPGESYSEVSVGRLSDVAGVSRVTFYAYFAGKGELLRARLDEIVADLHASSEPWWGLGPEVTRDDVHAALAQIVATYRAHHAVMAALNDEAAYAEDVRDLAASMMDEGVGNLLAHLRRGQAEGWVDPALPARETAAWLMWMGERAHHQLLRESPDELVAEHLDTYTDLVYKTLYRF